MQPAPPALQLAVRLRQLRVQQWADARLTQQDLATVFSTEEQLASATVSSWENRKSPKLPPEHRLRAYARFFATRRSIEAGPVLLAFEELTPDEKAACEKLETELLKLRSAAAGESAEEEIAFSRSWHFADNGPVTFVCAELHSDEAGPLANPSNPNYTELQAFADIDALMELHGHVRAENPQMLVHFKISAEIDRDVLSGHLILLGGFLWNDITERLSELARLPIRQFQHPEVPSGELFIAKADGTEKEFWPKWTGSERKVLEEDVGLLARVPNPLNSNRTLTICNGIHSRGVYGAVRSLTDTSFRDANERYISKHFGNSESFAILMSVKIINNKAMTPDLSGRGVVLYQWSQDRAA
jgi:hypothetical protein